MDHLFKRGDAARPESIGSETVLSRPAFLDRDPRRGHKLGREKRRRRRGSLRNTVEKWVPKNKGGGEEKQKWKERRQTIF